MKKEAIKHHPPVNQQPRIRYVKRAGSYVRTSWKDGKQVEEWLSKREYEKEFNEII